MTRLDTRPTAATSAGMTRRSARVTLVTNVFPALSETFVLDQITSLLAMGHDVGVIADEPRDEQVVHEDVAKAGLMQKVRYLALPRTTRGRVALALRTMRQNGLRSIKMLMALTWARLQVGETGYVRTLATVAALGQAPRPDVILCHFGPNGSRIARSLDMLGWTDIPIVTIFHGYDLSLELKIRPRIYRYLFDRGRLFLPVCDAFANLLRTIGCPAERILVQRMCVDLARIDAFAVELQATPLLAGVFTFLTVARLVPKKGIADTIQAFAAAFAHLPLVQVRLRLIGDGPLRTELEAIAQRAGVADRVEFLGALPRRAVLSTMLLADALVQNSITAADGDMEGLPVVISEAMALGKPVLSTRHSGIPELVVDGSTGVLVGEGDVAALAAAMTWMVANQQAAGRMGQAGRERLEQGFTAQRWNALLEQRLLEVACPA